MENLCHPEFTDYTITREGFVYNNIRNKWLKPHFNSGGYIRCWVKGKHRFVHRLVAQTYIMNYDNLKCIDHIDRNKINNNVNNLRWITYSNNNLNKGKNKNNKIGIKNICYDKREKKYQFSKIVRGQRYQKNFKTLEEAENYKIDWHILNNVILS